MVVLLNYIVVGEGSVIPIILAGWETVSVVKKAVADELKYTGRADKLRLYLTKTAEGSWLPSKDPLVRRMRNGEIPEEVASLYMTKELDEPTDQISTILTNEIIVGTIQLLVMAPIVSQDGVFNHCTDPFFSQFPTVDQAGDWLEFSSLLPLTERQKLYVRSSYKSIAAQALLKVDPNRRKYAVVTGTPGVGKSVFVYYVMWRLIKERKRVVFITRQPPIYFDGLNMRDCDQLPKPGNRQFWSPDLWCLVDSEDPTKIVGMPIERCSVLLASTPRRDCIAEFKKKVPTPVVLYMPVWTKEELSTVAPLYPNAQGEWEHRFRYLGGVPRTVLQDIETNAQVLLELACKTCSLEDCKTTVSINSEINGRTKIAQTLIHIHSQEPYREMEVVYASELAMLVIARTKLVSNRLGMESFLSACNGNPLAQTLCGYIFEPYCMRLLHKGGRFEYRELLSDAEKKRKRGLGGIIEIPASSQPSLIAERVEDDQLANQLYVPRTSNFVAIDAWMPQFGRFQMTVGKNHDIKGGAADNLEKLGKNGNRLFFLLPPLYYETFTKKKPMKIKQFAMLVPYPEEV